MSLTFFLVYLVSEKVYPPLAESTHLSAEGVATTPSTPILTEESMVEADSAPSSPQSDQINDSFATYQPLEEEEPMEEADSAPSSPQSDQTNDSFVIYQPLEEDSMEDVAVDGDITADETTETRYLIVEASTQRGRPKLVDSVGYSSLCGKSVQGLNTGGEWK